MNLTDPQFSEQLRDLVMQHAHNHAALVKLAYGEAAEYIGREIDELTETIGNFAEDLQVAKVNADHGRRLCRILERKEAEAQSRKLQLAPKKKPLSGRFNLNNRERFKKVSGFA